MKIYADREELKKVLIEDKLLRSDGGLNSAFLKNRIADYDLSNLEGETIQEKLYLLFHEKGKCIVCGKTPKFRSWSSGYLSTCCRECKKAFDSETLRKNQSVIWTDDIREKRKQTCIEKYGVDNVFKSSDIKNQIKEVLLDKYGVEHPAQNKDIMAKMEQTNKSNHNGLWNCQTEKCRQSWRDRRDEIVSDFEAKHNCTEILHIINEYGQGFSNLDIPIIEHKRWRFIDNKYLPLIKEHYEEYQSNRTHAEVEIYNFIKSLLPNVKIIQNGRKAISINGRAAELDLYIPEKKIAIEYNGNYWHSEKIAGVTRQFDKTEACKEKGIRLVHIWEDLWSLKKDIYKSILASILGIYQNTFSAEECEVRELPVEDYNSFLSTNHIDGIADSTLRLGLYYNNTLIQVAGWRDNELQRICSLLNTQVAGGFNKLIEASNLSEIISCVDRDICTEEDYLNMGFNIQSNPKPEYFYFNGKFGRVYNPENIEVFFKDYTSGSVLVAYRK